MIPTILNHLFQYVMKLVKQTILLFLFINLFSCKNPNGNTGVTGTRDTSQLFTLLSPDETGVAFTNLVEDGEKFNILTYRNFYNGGGVAIGDINNDSLPDLYFTANQQKNKLYLNKGNFVFEDITEKAGVGGSMDWSTGVTMADVNNDGFLDIYVCNSGDVDGARRENELFINNGDLTFTEKAKELNLNNEGYSTHASFFDYDMDGDLDCYILNNSFKDPAKIELYRKVREEPDKEGDKLMRNDGGVFHDATIEAGIYSSNIGFGLGVAVSDLNDDQMPDIYISNDFWERDYLYINKGDGTFSEELIQRINYCSISSMGADVADLNNDGSPEIFTTDMLPSDNLRLKTTIAFDPYHLEDLKYRANFHYQMVQNCLHLNDGNGAFQEIALLSGVAATDWSWGALIFDFENDGYKDIFVSNGILKDIMSMDFREFIADAQKRNEIVSQKGKLDYRDFISYMPSNPLKNYAFQQTGRLIYKNQADVLGLGQPSFSNGSAYGDLDNDGDLDLVVNNINSPSFIYRNESNKKRGNNFLKVRLEGHPKNPFGIGAQVTMKVKNEILVLQNFNTRGFESSIEPNLLFGVGKASIIDTVTVVWPDRKMQVLTAVPTNTTIRVRYAEATGAVRKSEKRQPVQFEEVGSKIMGDFRHAENPHNDFNDEGLLLRMLSTEGPRVVKGDVNGDGQEDFILLGAAGDPDKLFLQMKDGTFRFRASPGLTTDKAFESTCGALFDHDRDGDLDLMIGSGGNETQVDKINFVVRFYRNDGRGNFTASPGSIPQVIGNFSTLEANDYDNDGDTDVFLGARVVPGNYGLPPQSYLLNNDNGNWINVAPAALGNVGMVTDATWADADGDKDNDLIVVGDWMAITIFDNDNGVIDGHVTIPDSKGWWNRIESADLDNDGDIDFVLGNWGLNTKFKASPDKPVSMHVNDFDGNGKSEFIIEWFAPQDSIPYPFSPKGELVAQLPGLRKSILKYQDYARKSYDSLFSAQVIAGAIPYEVSYLSSAVLWNEGKSYLLSALPLEAQVSPVFGIVADDLDGDGHRDIWLGGNFYAMKPQAGRHDASRGVFLKGASNKSFVSVPHTGIYVEGEVRDAVLIRSKDITRIIVARNNERILVFQRR